MEKVSFTPDLDARANFARDIAFVVNQQGIITSASESVGTMLGYTATEFIRQPMHNFADADSRAMLDELHQHPATDESPEPALIRMISRTPDGELDTRFYAIGSFLIPWTDDVRYEGRDVTDVIFGDRLKRILVHDLGSVLATLTLKNDTALDQIGKKKVDIDRVSRDLGGIQSGLLHAADLVRRLSSLLKMPGTVRAVRLEGVDVHRAIVTLSEVVRAENFQVIVDPLDEAWLPILANDQVIGSIVFGLMNNAHRYADPERLAAGDSFVRVGLASEQEPGYMIFKIEDNGIGISRDHLDDLFKFGKSTGNGHGFSLWWMKQELKNLEGKIWVESKKGKGTTFFVRIPVSDK